MQLKSNSKILKLDKPLVMGVLNVTPDSFSDGGKYANKDQAVQRFEQMVEEGADIIDIGGESTGPGSVDVSVEEELNRIIPVLKEVRKRSDIWISIDTYKAEVAKQTVHEGADMINDVLALRGDAKMTEVLSKSGVPIAFMFSKEATGRTTKNPKEYQNVVKYVYDFMDERIKTAEENGIKRDRLIIDPGQGVFVSSDPKYSLQILKNLNEFKKLGQPLLIGSSRKSVVGLTLKLPLHDRLEGSLTCAAVAVMNGANIVRAHDVKETRRVVDMVDAILKS